MWQVRENFKTNDGCVQIYNRDAPEDVSRLILVFPETKPKRGQGHNHVDLFSENLAQEICNFLNTRNLK